MTFAALQKEMIAAMKAKDKTRKEAVSSLIANIKKVAIDEGIRNDIPDDMVDRLILKEIKSLKEQVDTCPDSRPELKEEYAAKLAVITEFAPKLMSRDEIRAFLTESCAEGIAQKNKGLIMRTAMASLKGKADGKEISAVVEELLK